MCVSSTDASQHSAAEHQEPLSAEHSRAEQSRAEQARAEQSRAEQARAEQSRAERARAEPPAVVPSSLPANTVCVGVMDHGPNTDEATLPLFEDILPSEDVDVLYDIQTPHQSNALRSWDVHAINY